jgi:hypothetical protein
MQKLLGFILLCYFLSGTLLLPQGDFATLPDLPKMYAHCRDTEDKDLEVPEFIISHLLLMDDLLGEVPEPDDKPHQPVQFHHIYSPILVEVHQVIHLVVQPLAAKNEPSVFSNDIYLSDYPVSVFRPPIV